MGRLYRSISSRRTDDGVLGTALQGGVRVCEGLYTVFPLVFGEGADSTDPPLVWGFQSAGIPPHTVQELLGFCDIEGRWIATSDGPSQLLVFLSKLGVTGSPELEVWRELPH